MKESFIQAFPIIERLEKEGYEAYFVGGAVRDFIIGRPIGDIDIATSAMPEDIICIFEKTIPVGIEHGTVVVLQNGVPYEVTTFRTEGEYEDYRRPSSVSFVSTLEEDLKRRDFTVNAMAMTKQGHIIDPFGGRSAIEKRIIDTVGNASERFHEDALRMMRAVRFVSQLGFSLSPKTKQAIGENVSLLKHVSIERITVEFEKVMAGKQPEEAFSLLIETGLSRCLPGFHLSRQADQRLKIAPWSKAKHIYESWAMLLEILEVESVSGFLKKWKVPNKLIKEVQLVLSGYRDMQNQRWTLQSVYQYGLEASLHIGQLRLMMDGQQDESEDIRRLYADLPIYSLQDMAVNGKDVMEICRKKGGPWLASLLHEIEQKVVAGELENDKEAIKEWLKSCNQIFDEHC